MAEFAEIPDSAKKFFYSIYPHTTHINNYVLVDIILNLYKVENILSIKIKNYRMG